MREEDQLIIDHIKANVEFDQGDDIDGTYSYEFSPDGDKVEIIWWGGEDGETRIRSEVYLVDIKLVREED
jgi:hypothetical protein